MARRVGLFDYDIAQQAVRANGPQFIALTGLDNLQRSLNIEEIRNHYGSIDDFKSKLESTLKVPIGIESWGPSIENVVDKRARIN
jgi:adenylosuccinate synthase